MFDIVYYNETKWVFILIFNFFFFHFKRVILLAMVLTKLIEKKEINDLIQNLFQSLWLRLCINKNGTNEKKMIPFNSSENGEN